MHVSAGSCQETAEAQTLNDDFSERPSVLSTTMIKIRPFSDGLQPRAAMLFGLHEALAHLASGFNCLKLC